MRSSTIVAYDRNMCTYCECFFFSLFRWRRCPDWDCRWVCMRLAHWALFQPAATYVCVGLRNHNSHTPLKVLSVKTLPLHYLIKYNRAHIMCIISYSQWKVEKTIALYILFMWLLLFHILFYSFQNLSSVFFLFSLMVVHIISCVRMSHFFFAYV